jgi:UDP-N-acetyl-D-galactosamine dehydrogenase
MLATGFESKRPLKVAVIGVGYVGLPLVAAFGRHTSVVGFDLNTRRVEQLSQGIDKTDEVSPEELADAVHARFSADPADIRDANVYVVTVPTPVDVYKKPDLSALLSASAIVGAALKPGDVVVYESTVYPGATEEDCVPILEQQSGLKLNSDFYVGYSPERINPGDKKHRLQTITKVTSGSTPEAARFINELYASIVPAGTHMAPSIRVAEAAKVIENIQRDVNIALVNELALLFKRMEIDTGEVLAASGTKWNFLPFKPGLVGGHCIGIDPYYLTHKAASVGFHPEMILAGRRINDFMAHHVAEEVVQLMARRRIVIPESRILILGLTFKPNTPDIRNTKVKDLVDDLMSYGGEVHIHDPRADPDDIRHEFDLPLKEHPERGGYDAVVLAVPHEEYLTAAADLRGYCRENGILYEVGNALRNDQVDGRL